MNDDKALYNRDPEAWNAYLAEGNRRQPRKRVSADLVIRNSKDQVLLVNPTYKPDWDLPGGMVEANEPPFDAAKREVQEELGFKSNVGALLCVDWVSPHGPWDDLISFIFDGGHVNDAQVERFQLRDKEISAYEFCDEAEAAARLRPYVWRRLSAALDSLRTGSVHYLQDGYRQDGDQR